MMPACGSANIPDCLFSALRYALARLSHRCSSAGYDEPAILSYAISSFCPTSADGLHRVVRGLQQENFYFSRVLRGVLHDYLTTSDRSSAGFLTLESGTAALESTYRRPLPPCAGTRHNTSPSHTGRSKSVRE